VNPAYFSNAWLSVQGLEVRANGKLLPTTVVTDTMDLGVVNHAYKVKKS
jgi:hypothetical protein